MKKTLTTLFAVAAACALMTTGCESNKTEKVWAGTCCCNAKEGKTCKAETTGEDCGCPCEGKCAK
jgi:hypothetical protein